MNLITRFNVWFRQFKRRQAARRQKGPLREFVYLDEVSVYSLIASRLGPIAAEFTDTETTSLQGEIGGSIGATAGVAKADIKSKLLNSETKGSQILRKSTVQTTFKELYEYELERDSFAIQLMTEGQKLPKIPTSIDGFAIVAKTPEYNGWIVNPDKLTRGQLFDLEVQLEADVTFRVSAVISAFLEILEEDAEILGLNSNIDLVQMKSIGRILEKLLVGLVPVRGQAIDYCVVEFEQKEWIIHRKLLSELPFNNLLTIRPLYIVGVAEQTLFWKDIRRILFSKAPYHALCRIAQDGLQNSWTPVKLADVFESVFPGLANPMKLSGLDAITKMVDTSKSSRSKEAKQQLIHDALVNYAELLGNHYHLDITSQALDQISLISNQYCVSFSNLKEKREAFEAIATYLINNFEIERDPLTFAQYRAVALTDAGLDFLGNPISLVSDNVTSPSPSDERFLDTEFVAIYW